MQIIWVMFSANGIYWLWFSTLWFEGSMKKFVHRMWKSSASSQTTLTQERRYGLVLVGTWNAYLKTKQWWKIFNDEVNDRVQNLLINNYHLVLCLPSIQIFIDISLLHHFSSQQIDVVHLGIFMEKLFCTFIICFLIL